jgi:O-antigen ligase
MFRDHPFVGFGPGNWAWHAEQLYATDVMKRFFIRPTWNCLYWEILVDLGLVGFSVFVWFFLSFFRQLSRAARRSDDIFIRALSAGFIVGFIALLGEYYVAFNFYRVYVWVIFGIAMATIRLSKEEQKVNE